MVYQIIFSKEAEGNLLEIQQYIAQNSFYYAEKVIKEIIAKIQTLQSQPEQGMVVITSEAILYRRLLYKSYRIIYFYKQPIVYIVAVFHQARQIPDHFDNHLFT